MSVVDVVLEEIGGLGVHPGDRLPSERKLAELCDISRSSVRNALKELQSKRILAAKPGSGYYLASNFALHQALSGVDTEWTMERLQQVFDARVYVAAHVTKLGSVNITDSSLQELENCLVDLGKAVVNVDIRAMEILHNRFLDIIHESCSNPEYIRMLNEVQIPSQYVVSILQVAGGEERNDFFSEHVNLFQAVKKRNHTMASDVYVRICGKLSELFSKYASVVF